MNKIEIVEEINSGNLYLQKVGLSDVDFYFESLQEKAIIKYLSLGPLRSLDHSNKLIKNYLKYWDDKIQFNYVIQLKEGKRLKRLGAISLWNISWLHNRSEVGIWINTKYWNQGYAKRALKMLKIIAFNHLNINRLEAHIATKNSRSINLFKNNGFNEEGALEDYLNIKSIYHNALILSCLKKNENILE